MLPFAQLKRAAASEGLRFLIIGGHAVMQHGYLRATEDVDLLADTADRDRWEALVCGLGYRVVHVGRTFLQFGGIESGHWDLDVMFVVDETFARMLAEAKTVLIERTAVMIPTLEHLLALKLHVLKHGHALKSLRDLDDIVNLVTLNQVDVRSDRIRELFSRYGNLELYERVLRTLTP